MRADEDAVLSQRRNCDSTCCDQCGRDAAREVSAAAIVLVSVVFTFCRIIGVSGTRQSFCIIFAFGIGIERTAMVNYSVPDLRTMYKNDVRFLKQMK